MFNKLTIRAKLLAVVGFMSVLMIIVGAMGLRGLAASVAEM